MVKLFSAGETATQARETTPQAGGTTTHMAPTEKDNFGI